MIICKKCSSQKHTKSGYIRGFQRYKCSDCGCQFTRTKPRGVHPSLRELAVVLYAHFGVSMRGIARLCKVSTVAVLKWIRAYSDKISASEKAETGPYEVVQVDEMWHFVNGKKTKFGSGARFVGCLVDLLDGTSVIVLTKV